MTNKKEPVVETRYDLFGAELAEGAHVIIARSTNSMLLCKIVSFKPKMMRVQAVKSRQEYLVYAEQTVRVDSEDVLAYILKTQLA